MNGQNCKMPFNTEENYQINNRIVGMQIPMIGYKV